MGIQSILLFSPSGGNLPPNRVHTIENECSSHSLQNVSKLYTKTSETCSMRLYKHITCHVTISGTDLEPYK